MIDDRTEVEVDGEVMTLGELTARLDKLAETETPFEREQRGPFGPCRRPENCWGGPPLRSTPK